VVVEQSTHARPAPPQTVIDRPPWHCPFASQHPAQLAPQGALVPPSPGPASFERTSRSLASRPPVSPPSPSGRVVGDSEGPWPSPSPVASSGGALGTLPDPASVASSSAVSPAASPPGSSVTT
jgi:hypothetical protein